MEKKLAEMNFDEMVLVLIEQELNDIVRGVPLAKRVKFQAMTVLQWKHDTAEHAKKKEG